MISIYLDTCAIQRPLDTLSQTRFRLEAEAVLGILELVSANEVRLVISIILGLEVEQTPLVIRREHGRQVLSRSQTIVIVTPLIAERAAFFVQQGMKATDALHLASAKSAEVDYFCTCDDRFLRRAKKIDGLQMTIVSPLELVEALEP